MKRGLLVLLVGLLVVGALVGAQVVMAQGPVGPDTPPAWGQGPAFGSGFGDGAMWQRRGPSGPEGSRTVRARYQWQQIQTIADSLNMSTQDLIAALRAGKTVAEVAEEQGVDLATVVDALVAPRAERLSRAVEAGRLTEEQADALLAMARIQIENRLNRPFRLASFIVAAHVLDMDAPDLWAELRDGKSVADVAEEKGVPLEEIVDAILAPKAEYLNQLVADGRLTQDQADTLLAMARQRVENMLTRAPCTCEGKGLPGSRRGGWGQ